MHPAAVIETGEGRPEQRRGDRQGVCVLLCERITVTASDFIFICCAAVRTFCPYRFINGAPISICCDVRTATVRP